MREKYRHREIKNVIHGNHDNVVSAIDGYTRQQVESNSRIWGFCFAMLTVLMICTFLGNEDKVRAINKKHLSTIDSLSSVITNLKSQMK